MLKTNPFKSYAIAIALSTVPFFVHAQSTLQQKPNWQNLDLAADSTFGISTEKAYTELLKGKKSTPVLVAVIDGGVDIEHEDLKKVIWNNPKEKDGNKKDDDKNGYIDDMHGWDFIGSAKGEVNFDNMEVTRIIRKLQPKFASVTSASAVSAADMADYTLYQKAVADRNTLLNEAQQNLQGVTGFKTVLDSIASKKPQGTDMVTYLKAYTPKNQMETRIKTVVVRMLSADPDFEKFKKEKLQAAIDHYKETIDYHLNLSFNPRDIVGDNYDDINEHFYGNKDVTGPDAHHGTHVAGIIGAVRDNNLGIKGVADNVIIMSVRTVPNGDERDKDVANAIRYAAANGAKVINMSFGKPYKWNKKAVDEAVKFAASKDVLIIHAAGNDNKNLDVDTNFNYPNKVYEDKSGSAADWIEVGASGPKDDQTLKASFSNYGKNNVDVFAPGVKINSTTPGSTYAEYDGTSMASPVVAGLAALIRSYYPKLSAVQVKDIILKSAIKVNHNIVIMDGVKRTEVPFSDLCNTGAIVNAYNALKMADSMK